MKKKISNIMCGVAVLSVSLCGCTDKKPDGGSGTIQTVQWVKARDWSITDNGTNYAIEFGFRPDGALFWRKGEKL